MNRLATAQGRPDSLIGYAGSRRRPGGLTYPTGLFFLLILALLLSSGILTGCASLGLQSPQGFNEKVAAGYTSVTTVRESAATLLRAGSITPQEAQKIQDKCDEARAGLDTASSLKGVDLKSAENRLAAVTQLIVALQSFVADRKNGVQTAVPQ